MQQKQTRRDRPLFVDLALIGAVMAALLAGGLHLLGKTRAAWDSRNAERASHAASVRAAVEDGEAAQRQAAANEAEYQRLKSEAELRRIRYEKQERDDYMKNKRCINGTLFKVEGSSYTNIGRC